MLVVGLTVDSYDMQNSIQSINPQSQLVAAGKGKILKLFENSLSDFSLMNYLKSNAEEKLLVTNWGRAIRVVSGGICLHCFIVLVCLVCRKSFFFISCRLRLL